MSALILLAIALILAKLFPYIIVYAVALGYRFQPMWLEPTNVEQIPTEIRSLMQPWIDRLIGYDFQIVSYRLVHNGLINQPAQWGIIFQHSSDRIFAGLMVKPKPDIRYPVVCTFSSFWQETHLSTINIGDLNSYSKTDLEITNHLDRASIEELWSGHRAFVQSICVSDELERMTVDEWVSRLEQLSKDTIELRAKKREIYWSYRAAMVYRQHPWLTLKMVFKIAKNRNKKSKYIKVIPEISEQNLDMEVRAFLAQPQKAGLGISPRHRIWLLIGSFIIFVIIYTSRFQSTQLIIFVLILLFHEGGHVLAMAACGYRDTTILFIPFLGALATGNKENASLSQKVWISLAGPLPGLFVGILLSIFLPNSHSWIDDARIMLISLNLFNLLPIYPLDGGQVVDLLIFSRSPYLAIGFQSFGLLILVTGAIGLNRPLMLFFAVLIAFSIPFNFQLVKLRSQLESKVNDLADVDRETLVRFIFRYLSTSKYSQLDPHRKALIVSSLVDDRQDKGNLLTRLGLSGIYLISLIGGFLGGLYTIVPNFDMWLNITNSLVNPHYQTQRYATKTIERANLQLKQNSQDISAYLTRGRGYLLLKQYSAALNDIDRAIGIDPHNYEAYSLRSEIRMRMGDKVAAIKDRSQSNKLLWSKQLMESNLQIQKQPNNFSAYVQRSYAKKMLGDKQGAIDDNNIALKLQPNSPEALLFRAEQKVSSQDYKSALTDVNRVLEIEPKNTEAFTLGASIYEKMGDRQSAHKYRQQADLLDNSDRP
jgi:Zn-dependent protease/cytochrome c-type biogenesis protein CcmH/NrfG